MCFTNDYDWYASVQEITDGPADRRSQCYECGAAIQSGEWRRAIFQQEHEECQRCEFEELEDDEEPCRKHDYGESFQCDLCQACCHVRAAINAVETDEGCPVHTREPAFGELIDALEFDDGRYRNRAIRMHPDLAGWFAKLDKQGAVK